MQIVKFRYSGGVSYSLHAEVIECTASELRHEVPFTNLSGKKDIETTISEKDWLMVTTKLEKIIQDWQPEYNDYNIQDGFNWKLTITDSSNNEYIYKGINAYPKNFKKFDKLLDKLRSLA